MVAERGCAPKNRMTIENPATLGLCFSELGALTFAEGSTETKNFLSSWTLYMFGKSTVRTFLGQSTHLVRKWFVAFLASLDTPAKLQPLFFDQIIEFIQDEALLIKLPSFLLVKWHNLH